MYNEWTNRLAVELDERYQDMQEAAIEIREATANYLAERFGESYIHIYNMLKERSEAAWQYRMVARSEHYHRQHPGE